MKFPIKTVPMLELLVVGAVSLGLAIPSALGQTIDLDSVVFAGAGGKLESGGELEAFSANSAHSGPKTITESFVFNIDQSSTQVVCDRDGFPLGGLYVHIYDVSVRGGSIGDMTFSVTSPNGVTSQIVSGQCAAADNMDILFAEAGALYCLIGVNGPYSCNTAFPIPSDKCDVEHDPLTGTASTPPDATIYTVTDGGLSQFEGEVVAGTWTMTIENSAGDNFEASWYLYAALCAGGGGRVPTPPTPPTPAPPVPTPPPTVSPKTGCCMGDPHFLTWNGTWYDFHGECDLVFLSLPGFHEGMGLTVHIRTTSRDMFSFIEGAAIKIGSDVLEVYSHGHYFVNGIQEADLPYDMEGLFTVSRQVQEDGKRHTFSIGLKHGKHLIIKVFKDLVNVKFEGATVGAFEKSVGLMGNFHNGAWLSRDGAVIEDANRFGMEWQVRDTEPQLFMVQRPPVYPQKCIMPEEAKAGGRRLGESIAEEAAAKACEHWGSQKDQCVYDVMATGDLDLAEAGAF